MVGTYKKKWVKVGMYGLQYNNGTTQNKGLKGVVVTRGLYGKKESEDQACCNQYYLPFLLSFSALSSSSPCGGGSQACSVFR